jgi:membrane protease YdiL (CAAX protease family)
MKEYLKLTLRPSYTYLMAVLLLLLYEGLAAAFIDPNAGEPLNLIDVLFNEVLRLLPFSTLWLGLLLAGIGLLLVWLDAKEGVSIQRNVLFGMLVESLVWALILLLTLPLVAGVLMPNALGLVAAAAETGRNALQDFIMSLGAGFYEELFFRLILVRIIVFFAIIFGYAPGSIYTRLMVALLTAVVFSLAHHIVEPFSVYAFLYRTLFGLLMSLLLIYRGFGITAWTHALYDVLVFFSR